MVCATRCGFVSIESASRRPEGPQLRKVALCLLGRAAVEHLDLGDGISCSQLEGEAEPELVRRGLLGLAEDRRELRRALDGVGQGAVSDGSVERMQAELEGSDDPEVGACSSDSPEEVRVLLLAGPHEPSVGRHELDGQEVVDGEAEPPLKPSHAAAQRQPRDSRVPDDSDRADEPERLRLLVELAEERAPVCARDAPLRVDLHAAHP